MAFSNDTLIGPRIADINLMAIAAGRIIMRNYGSEMEITTKNDKSPVTQADIEANNFIVGNLSRITPGIPVISEEQTANHSQPLTTECFWLVDPLDGTKSFIRKTGDFTVNIGLVKNRRPVFGVIAVPARGEIYFTDAANRAWKVGNGEKKEIHVSTPEKDAGFSFVVSHSHHDPETEVYLKNYQVRERKSASSAYKFCLIAEGLADIYPRFGQTMEWDTAAGHALVLAAGGTVTGIDGTEFLYAKPGFINPGFVVKTAGVL